LVEVKLDQFWLCLCVQNGPVKLHFLKTIKKKKHNLEKTNNSFFLEPHNKNVTFCKMLNTVHHSKLTALWHTHLRITHNNHVWKNVCIVHSL